MLGELPWHSVSFCPLLDPPGCSFVLTSGRSRYLFYLQCTEKEIALNIVALHLLNSFRAFFLLMSDFSATPAHPLVASSTRIAIPHPLIGSPRQHGHTHILEDLGCYMSRSSLIEGIQSSIHKNRCGVGAWCGTRKRLRTKSTLGLVSISLHFVLG